MGQRLQEIGAREVSLVRRGANRKRFFLAKADDSPLDEVVADIVAAPVAKEDELLEAVRAAGGDETVEKAAAAYARVHQALRDAFDGELPDAVAKAMEMSPDGETGDGEGEDGADDDGNGADDELDDVAKAYEERIAKKDYTAEQRQQMAKDGRALPNGSYPIEDRDDLSNAIHAIGRGKTPHPEIKAHIIRRARALGATDALPDDWKVQKEDGMSETAQAVPVKKEDGTWDLSAVPEEQRSTFEAFLKERDDELAEIQKQADADKSKAEEAIKIAKAERDARETREYIAKSAELDKLAKDDSEFGPVLKAIAEAERDEHLPQGTCEKLDQVLKAANEQVATGDLFSEFGRSARPSGDGLSKLEAAAAEIRKADDSLTKEQAVAKALQNDPSLYDEYQKAVA